ncbi:TIGR03943 family putative permease subunit [Brevibacillus migulae]|uniref:TIGR03943 family putative permease subunit n=1 Tax=Brevibacillus migulae TaxID=1644114 RepID=UPI00106DE514|nr:TIGR03943 family protein [Brevibacillus migulae]
MNAASLKRHYFIRSYVLLGFCFLLADLAATGKLGYYLAPRMHALAYVTLAILIILTGASFRQAIMGPTQYVCDCADSHGVPHGFWKSAVIYSLFVLPLAMSFFLPDKILGSAVAEKRGLTLAAGEVKREIALTQANANGSSSSGGQGQTEGLPPTPPAVQSKASSAELAGKKPKTEEDIRQMFAEQQFGDFYTSLAVGFYKQPVIQLDDKVFLDGLTTLELYPKQFSGKKLTTMGFVYREQGMAQNQFVTARFSVSCCTADAAVYGLLVESEQGSKLAKDSWVQVTGTLESRTVDDYDTLVLKAEQVKPVKAPKDPYVYYSFDTPQ